MKKRNVIFFNFENGKGNLIVSEVISTNKLGKLLSHKDAIKLAQNPTRPGDRGVVSTRDELPEVGKIIPPSMLPLPLVHSLLRKAT